MIIAAAQAAGRFVRAIGRWLPGHLVPNWSRLLVTSAPGDDLFALWTHNRSLRDIKAIRDVVEIEVRASEGGEASETFLRTPRFPPDPTEKHKSRLSYVKGLLAVAFASGMIGIVMGLPASPIAL